MKLLKIQIIWHNKNTRGFTPASEKENGNDFDMFP
jgi:hypothetical protein